jgi:hypothetical protein
MKLLHAHLALLGALLTTTTAVAMPDPTPQADGQVQHAALGYLTAGELERRCNDAAPSSVSYCYAYIAAVHDTMRAYEIWLNQREFCLPQAVPQAALKRIFLTYLSAYPTNRTGLASSVVAVALKTSAPCQPEPIKAPPPPGK